MSATNGAAAVSNGSSVMVVPEGWLTAHQMVERHGGSTRTLHRWAQEGRIARVLDAQGKAWFDPSDYENAKSAERVLEPAEAAKVEVRREEVQIAGSNELLKMLLKHQEAMHAPQSEATREVLKLLREENAALRAQNAELVKVSLDNMKAREELLSEAHARELELKQFEAAEGRKRAALELVKPAARSLLARLGASSVNDTQPAPAPSKLAPARALLASLSDEQLAMLVHAVRDQLPALLETDLLTDEQKAYVREVLL